MRWWPNLLVIDLDFISQMRAYMQMDFESVDGVALGQEPTWGERGTDGAARARRLRGWGPPACTACHASRSAQCQKMLFVSCRTAHTNRCPRWHATKPALDGKTQGVHSAFLGQAPNPLWKRFYPHLAAETSPDGYKGPPEGRSNGHCYNKDSAYLAIITAGRPRRCNRRPKSHDLLNLRGK